MTNDNFKEKKTTYITFQLIIIIILLGRQKAHIYRKQKKNKTKRN